jgi:hypothetical protein
MPPFMDAALRVGEGWLNTLPFWEPLRRRRRQMRRRKIRPARRARPTMLPTTIPAMAPPLRPFFFSGSLVGVAVELGLLLSLGVAVGSGSVIIPTIVGSLTPSHLDSAPEL